MAAAEVVPAVAVKLAEVEPAGTLARGLHGEQYIVAGQANRSAAGRCAARKCHCTRGGLPGAQAGRDCRLGLSRWALAPVGWSPSETCCCRCQ